MIKMFIKIYVMKGDQQASVHMPECGREDAPTQFSKWFEDT